MPTSALELEQRNWFKTEPIYFKKHICVYNIRMYYKLLWSVKGNTRVSHCAITSCHQQMRRLACCRHQRGQESTIDSIAIQRISRTQTQSCLLNVYRSSVSNVHCTPLWSCGKVFSWGINGLEILQFMVWVKFYCSSEGCIPYGSFAFGHVRRNPWVSIAFSQECGSFLVDWKATLGPHLLETLHNYTASLKCTCHKI